MFGFSLAIALALAPQTVQTTVVAIPPAPERIMQVPADLDAQFRAAVLVGKPSRRQRLQRIASFILEPKGLGMTYAGDANYTIEQAYRTRKANCLSFTLLFLALAREAGLDAYPQEIGDTFSWYMQDGTVYRTTHLNAGVRLEGDHYTMDVARRWVAVEDPPLRISDSRLIAHYYNNQAAMFFENGQLDASTRYMDAAIALEPGFPSAWNNAGVLNLKRGDRAGAEQAYARALSIEPDNIDALYNMTQLLVVEGRPQRAAVYRQQLEHVQMKDPLYHYMRALEYENAGNYAGAIDHYRRAIRLKRGEYRFHAALAGAYQLAGEPGRAEKERSRARVLGRRTGVTGDTPGPASLQQDATVQ